MIKVNKHVSERCSARPPRFDTPIFDLIHITGALIRLEEVSSQVKADKAKPHLHEGNLALAKRVKIRIATDPEYAELTEIYANRLCNPDIFKANKARFHTLAKDTMAKYIRETSIIEWTPVAARSLKLEFADSESECLGQDTRSMATRATSRDTSEDDVVHGASVTSNLKPPQTNQADLL
ncbi:hypothetical protein CONLIGDRAFT_679722 [Coniochaeta ligniaria NRRL 30616]|uniref:Uncharacterized protein n=1 Tax=Coniochaeta ligniaria NRRL 30616 TaxID=1408157 RepID=A0A1J7IUH1_9PEZI|nr:hypothetical protein CONLIGDRAFT_679722 [Coniochaeta ligniaria NRRL 30616]